MFGLSTLMTRIIIGSLGVALLLLTFQVTSCISAKREAAQGKVDKAQQGATINSAKDAISTQSEVYQNETASRDLDQKNAEEIRNAEGANAQVAAPVDRAGRSSLCRRAAYRDSEQCRVFRTTTP
jgi:hypothetical protein